mmetsp:Transcript_33419/g.73095  ORF Transcript_33419/g.73095 Transcript_33419/m.73095 type:complete len:536 (-) Transcript_33419:143-1750(-)
MHELNAFMPSVGKSSQAHAGVSDKYPSPTWSPSASCTVADAVVKDATIPAKLILGYHHAVEAPETEAGFQDCDLAWGNTYLADDGKNWLKAEAYDPKGPGYVFPRKINSFASDATTTAPNSFDGPLSFDSAASTSYMSTGPNSFSSSVAEAPPTLSWGSSGSLHRPGKDAGLPTTLEQNEAPRSEEAEAVVAKAKSVLEPGEFDLLVEAIKQGFQASQLNDGEVGINASVNFDGMDEAGYVDPMFAGATYQAHAASCQLGGLEDARQIEPMFAGSPYQADHGMLDLDSQNAAYQQMQMMHQENFMNSQLCDLPVGYVAPDTGWPMPFYPWPQQMYGLQPQKPATDVRRPKKANRMSPVELATTASSTGGPSTRPESEFTTTMLRHLPNNLTRDQLVTLLNKEGFEGRFDFMYVPVDFERKAGLGYAFVNWVNHEEAERAKAHFENFKDWTMQSDKVCTVAWGEPLQGLKDHIERYRNSPVMHENIKEEYKPALFNEHGKRVPFPEPTKRIRAPRLKHSKGGEHGFGPDRQEDDKA